MIKGAAALSLLLAGTSALAQQPAQPQARWDVANPPLPTREVRIEVDEGTWMNLDLSPDGRTIVFDLLGDIYTMPASGGAATRIAEGLPYEAQPRFSPDGRLIAFTSDRGGGDNIWIMNPDGSDKRQVTKETFETLNNPTWSADGRYIAARKHFTTTRSLGTGEIWLYHLGGGNGVPLVQRPNPQHQKELGEPTFAPSGDAIYFSRNTTPGPIFEYAEDSNRAIYAIERYDMGTGERRTVVSGAGGGVRPAPSPDGKLLAFVRRERARSKLYVKDLRTGEERKIYDDLDQDMQETWAVQGLYPNMDWTPDSRSILFWAGGKIRRVNADGTGAAEIPFRVADTRKLIDPVQVTIPVAPDTFTTRIPRFASVSPDGRRAVFESLGRIWVKDLSGDGAPRPLIAKGDGDFELWPSWSRDGRSIVYVSWNDRRLGEIRTVDANGSGVRTVTRTPGHYRRPRFSPDGKTIVFERGSSGGLTSENWSDDRGVFRVATAGGDATRLTPSGSNPHFGASNDRVFMETVEETRRRLVSVDMNGKDQRVHAEGSLVSGYQVSPTGDHLAFRENYNVFVMPFFPGAQTLTAGSRGNQLPIVRASGDGGAWFHWGANGRTLSWTMGPTLYSADTATLIRALPALQGQTAASFTPPKTGVSLAMPVEAEKPSGLVAIEGARIVTMAGADGGIIEDGVILVEANRIRAVGRRGEVSVPAGAKRVDATGKTIIPGLIDAHAHGPQGVDELVPQQNWSALAHLAFGVTTVHDPSSQAAHIFAAGEMQRAGIILAPRTFSTGETIYGARSFGHAQIEKYEDALAHVRRLKAQGAHSVKNYIMPRRDQRQQILAAAHQEQIPVVAEGGALFGLEIGHISDGNTTIEHNFPQSRLYRDVLSFFGQSKVGYTPTLVVTFGGLAGDPYWRMSTDVWKHPLLVRHVPPESLAESVRITKAPEEDFADRVSAANAHALSKNGVPVSIGGHGQEVGLASHWEMWSFVRGGMSPLEALRAATATPAQVYGFRDLGTLEAGKLADLVILDADPLADIRNSDKVSKVMLNGRLYDAATLAEEVTGNRRRQPYFWEDAR